MRKLSSLIPNALDLLGLEVEELAGVLLVHLNSCEPGDSVAVQNSRVHRGSFFGEARVGKPEEYPGRQWEVDRALQEAWAWLEREALIVDADHGWQNISRRGQRILQGGDYAAYKAATSLPKAQIHPLIATKVYPAFLRGEYDTAVFQAFREVEVSVRAAGHFSIDDYGADLMREAFRPNEKRGKQAGPLTDTELPIAEQQAMARLFASAFGFYRNSTAHRYVPITAEQAAEVIMFASQLLRIVDRRTPPRTQN